MSKSIQSHNGFGIHGGDRNLTYLYGISDFWSHIFENPEQIHDVLEANTFMLSEAYSRFLQLTSTLSLSDIQATANCQIKLVLLSSDDVVEGGTNEYTLPEEIVSCSYILNRPFLPTEHLESEVHFHIDRDKNTIRFHKPMENYLFPFRTLPDGSTQYSLWFSDVKADEKFVYKYFGKLIDLSPQNAVEVYKSYVQGLYYLYTNGPNIRFIERGLNLIMGVPIARETEVVTYVYKHVDTNDWIVVTNDNAYRIPYGLEPDYSVGDTVNKGDEVASWVEVKDWVEDDDWWIDLVIPEELIKVPPTASRRATAGSDIDYLMSKYLKNHSFLVRLKTAGVANFNIFDNISNVVSQVKPTYTFPVYVWDVPLADETIDASDDDFTIAASQHACEHFLAPNRDTFRRDTSLYHRGCPVFIRNNITAKADNWVVENINNPLDLSEEGDGELLLDPYFYSGEQSLIREDQSYTYITETTDALPSVTLTSDSNNANRAFSIYPTQVYSANTYDLEVEIANPSGNSNNVLVRGSLDTVNSADVSLFDLSIAPGSREVVTASFSPGSDGLLYINIIMNDGNNLESCSVHRASLKDQADSISQFNRGIVAMQNVYEEAGYTSAMMNAIMSRGNPSNSISRGHVTYKRRDSTEGYGVGVSFTIPEASIIGSARAFDPINADNGLDIESGNLVPIYVAREEELIDKASLDEIYIENLDEINAYIVTDPVGNYYAMMIRDYTVVSDTDPHEDLYNTVFLNSSIPKEGYRLNAPGQSAIRQEDFLVFIRILDDVYGVYWYSTKGSESMPYMAYRTDVENLKISSTATEFSRGHMSMNSRVYMTRGSTSSTYTDDLTVSPVTFDRSNTPVNTLNSEKEYA